MARGTTLRNVRIADELWTSAQKKAAAEGVTVSEVVRDLLTGWVTQQPR